MTSKVTTGTREQGGRRQRETESPGREAGRPRSWRPAALLVLGMAVAALAGFLLVNLLLIPDRSAPLASGADPKSLGSAGAPVEIIEFADFQCVPCGQVAEVVSQQLAPEYVSSGRVRLTYRHITVLGEMSVAAAVAAEAAAEQGAFWPYHDELFAVLSSEGRGAFTEDRLQKIASKLGLDLEQWNASRGSALTLERVQNETRQAEQLGVRQTPTVLIAGQKVEGAQPYSVLKQLIDQRLQAAGL
jgi:protein-disulfide isomerase